MAITKGNKIKLEYQGTLDDGTVFDDSSRHGELLEFEAGAGKVIRGFDSAVMGMEVGEEKTFRIDTANAYGEYHKELVKELPRSKLPPEELFPGAMLLMGTPDGAQMPVKVITINETTATLDLNHPLAGKALTFKIKVVSIE